MMALRVALLALIVVVGSMAVEEAAVVSLNEPGQDCDAAHQSTNGVCEAFGFDSDACFHSTKAYRAMCNTDLGESMSVGAPMGTNMGDLSKKSKKYLRNTTQKLAMAYAMCKRAAQHMRSEMQAQAKNCAQSGKKAEKSEEEALKQ